MTIKQMAEKLREMSDYEGSEVGETWYSLGWIYEQRANFSKEFRGALDKEVEKEYVHATTNFKLVERKENRVHVYKELVYIG